MATAIAIKRRRGTTVQHSSFTGLVGEITVDTDLKELRLHDGSTAGGKIISGDVRGPASSTDNAIVRFDGTGGKTVQSSAIIVADTTGDMSGVGLITKQSGDIILPLYSYTTYEWLEEMGGANGTRDFTRQASGTGSGSTTIEPTTALDIKRRGLNQVSTGTTTTGRCGFYSGSVPIVTLGQGVTITEHDVRIDSAVSDVTNTYSLYGGFSEDPSAATTNNMAQIRYSHGVNSGKWLCETADNGATTTADSGVVVAIDTWYRLRVEVNAAGTSVVFKINGSVVATITTNIPIASGRAVMPFQNILKSAGTTARTYLTDRAYWNSTLAVAI